MSESLIVSAIILVFSTAMNMLAASARTGSAQKAEQRGIENTLDTQVPLPVVYGKRRIGINTVDMSLDGSDNKYFY